MPGKPTPHHYSGEELTSALRSVGLRSGDVVLSHSNIGYFGLPKEGASRETAYKVILASFKEALGHEGTLVVPSFTYSFCKGEIFDPETTPSTCGGWSEYVRLQSDTLRSHDPIFSVAAQGAKAKSLTEKVPVECFGENCFWERFLEADGTICNLNVWVASTFIHYVEKRLGVPYRYDKLFPGTFSVGGTHRRGTAIFFCQDASNFSTRAETEEFDALAIESGLAKKISVGRGYITAMKARDAFDLIKDTLPAKAHFLITAGKESSPLNLLKQNQLAPVSLSDNASMIELIERIHPLARDTVSDAYGIALEALSRQIPMQTHEYPTGTRCLSSIVPERWTCREAYIDALDGRRILDNRDTPLHTISYSQPFEGTISREELLSHIKIHPHFPDAVPFEHSNFEKRWGLCISRTLRDSLHDDFYQVKINAQTSFGTLKVGEIISHGTSKDGFILSAHLDGPGQANSGLSGVAVGLKVMQSLISSPLRHTVRMLIVSEKFGSPAWLSSHMDVVPTLRAGLHLDMLGLRNPHALQFSKRQHTVWDQLAKETTLKADPLSSTAHFLKITDGEEQHFNAPGIEIPMLSLSRAEQTRPPDKNIPFPEYRSTLDSPKLISAANLAKSADLVISILKSWDDQAA